MTLLIGWQRLAGSLRLAEIMAHQEFRSGPESAHPCDHSELYSNVTQRFKWPKRLPASTMALAEVTPAIPAPMTTQSTCQANLDPRLWEHVFSWVFSIFPSFFPLLHFDLSPTWKIQKNMNYSPLREFRVTSPFMYTYIYICQPLTLTCVLGGTFLPSPKSFRSFFPISSFIFIPCTISRSPSSINSQTPTIYYPPWN